MTATVRSRPAGQFALTSCRLDDDGDIALTDALALLSEAEEARRARFAFERDRARFARARAFLRVQLGQLLGRNPADVHLGVRSGGKPYVPGAPFDFNLSHSGDLAVLGVSGSGSIGVDLELVDRDFWRAEDLSGLARLCLTRAERAALKSTEPEGAKTRFLRYWTAKEARMKIFGEGMALAPKRIALHLRGGEAVGYDAPEGPHVALSYVALRDARAIVCVATASRRGMGCR